MRMLAAAFAVASAVAAAAENLVIARDGTVVRVSGSEPNLIEASAGRITAFVFSEDAFDASSDPESGVVYFRPLQEGPRSGFVEYEDAAGERRRVSLVLVAQDGAIAQRIVVRAEDAEQPDPAPAASLPAAAAERTKALKAFLRELAGSGLAVAAVPDALAFRLAGGVELSVVASAYRDGWEGQVARIENTADTPAAVSYEAIALLMGNTVAVAGEADSLEAHQSATVYLVRETDATGIDP